jgi:undecaprenyl-diphosphatase
LFAAANAALSDTISSHFLKQLFGRPRPCGDFYFSSHVKLLANYCGANGSFPSSHATNHFALAMFFFVTLKPLKGRWQYLFFLWAAIICFAQVYVGVHYPSDIVGGTILGCFIGWVMGNYFNTKVGALA